MNRWKDITKNRKADEMLKIIEQTKHCIQVENEDYGVSVDENEDGIIVNQYFIDGPVICVDERNKYEDYPSVYKKEEKC